jgi:hypothetical protein
VPCSASRVVTRAHRVVGPGTHRGSGPREVHTTIPSAAVTRAAVPVAPSHAARVPDRESPGRKRSVAGERGPVAGERTGRERSVAGERTRGERERPPTTFPQPRAPPSEPQGGGAKPQGDGATPGGATEVGAEGGVAPPRRGGGRDRIFRREEQAAGEGEELVPGGGSELLVVTTHEKMEISPGAWKEGGRNGAGCQRWDT